MSTTVPRWHAAWELFRSFELMSRAEGQRLTQLLKASRQRFYPLSDPLDVQFHLHRQLSASREEVYSNWLQWVLQQVRDPGPIGRILGSARPDGFANSQEPISIDREEWVERGHVDQTGKLDLVVRQGNQILAVVEVKTREYSAEDLKKHKGYRDSLASTSPGAELIFLAVERPEFDLGGFRFVSWADVCIALRIAAAQMLAPEQILGTSLILAFVGAVEQNLLGFASPGAGPIPIGRIPRMADHLARAEKPEATHERP